MFILRSVPDRGFDLGVEGVGDGFVLALVVMLRTKSKHFIRSVHVTSYMTSTGNEKQFVFNIPSFTINN